VLSDNDFSPPAGIVDVDHFAIARLLRVGGGRLWRIEEAGEHGLDERALPLLHRGRERRDSGDFEVNGLLAAGFGHGKVLSCVFG